MSLDYPQEPEKYIDESEDSPIFREWRMYARQLESILDLHSSDLDAARPYLICVRDEDCTLKAVKLAAKYGGDPEDIPEYLRNQPDDTRLTAESFTEIIWRAFRRVALNH